ncbi:MAG TPA: thiamine pyrophosphate-binding protein [Vicinamibacterales bacterium]|nr:thiamine pyrophosphate-binding protein [Vicinamibacterales bacterium]
MTDTRTLQRHEPAAGAATPGWALGVSAGIQATGSRHVVYVPDNPLSHVLRTIAARYPDIATILATREEEAFGIAAGLYLGGGRPTVLLQSSGLGNSLNALSTLLVAYQIPVLAIISMRGDAAEWNWAQVPMGRLVRPALDALGIQHVAIEHHDHAEEAEAAVVAVGTLAFGARVPAACLLPRRVTMPVAATREARG